MSEDRITLKRAEISIQRFNDVGIPHHLGLLRNHKSNIKKCLALGDWDKIQKEEINATRVVKQLKTLLMEMDSLRNKLFVEDVDKFDKLTLTSRQNALDEIKSYMDLKLKSPSTSKSSTFEEDDENQPLDIQCIPQIQADFQLSEHQLRSREACLAEFEKLQQEIQDLHQLFYQLHGEVHIQKEGVDEIVENVEETHAQVVEGEQSLRQAVRYKKAMYPVCGGLIGMCIGGPVGLLAGAKIGGAAAVCCAFLGFTGGSAIKRKEELDVKEQ